MAGEKEQFRFDPNVLKREHQDAEMNRHLLHWLADDDERAALYDHLNEHHGGVLPFPSRDASPRHCECRGVDEKLPQAPSGHATVTLVTCRNRIVEILKNTKDYSSRIYAELGGGSFMLALDPGREPAHAAQVAAFGSVFAPGHGCPKGMVEGLFQPFAHEACRSAAVLGLRAPEFDLAAFAEAAALRFVQLLFGYAVKDYGLLERALGAAYRALVYQVMERHFVTDPTLIPVAKAATGELLARTSALIDAYADEDEDALRGTRDRERPGGFPPVLQALGRLPGNLNGEQRAVIAVGSAIGTVGNVQAAVCIAIKSFFADTDHPDQAVRAAARTRFDRLRALALTESLDRPTGQSAQWKGPIARPLRQNPPIPFLPRLKIDPQTQRKVGEVLLALGGGTAGEDSGLADDADDGLVWGLAPDGPHWCLGRAMAWPLIVEIVRHVMALPGLAQGLDPETGRVKGLEKRHGFACTRYPLTHRRDRRCTQTSLNVAMRIKAPVHENARRLRELIRWGAPRIEATLRASLHVHFAWFELIEADTVLVLHTVYDGPFGAYLQHFALDAGDLFDVLFEYIEDPPPRPVDRFPNEFVAHLLRYDRGPVGGYFFSAYPTAEAAKIVRNERRGP